MKHLKFFMAFLFLILLMSSISASKSYDPETNTYTTYDWLIFKKYDISLIKIQDSLIDAYAEGELEVHKKNKVFKKLYFTDKQKHYFDFDESKNQRYTFYLNESVQWFRIVNRTYEDINCVESANQTVTICDQNETGFDWESYFIEGWKEVDINAKIEVGSYKWKIVARKPINSKVDFIITTDSDGDLDQWAWWNTSFSFKQNLTNLSGSYYPTFNVTFNANMQDEQQDIRFTNEDETVELNFTQRLTTSSGDGYYTVHNAWNDSTIWMYYGNAVVSTLSSANKTFDNPSIYLPMDELSGTARDLTLGGHNGTTSTTKGATGHLSKAYDFNGSGSYVLLTDMQSSSTSHTFYYWLEVDTKASFDMVYDDDSGDAGDRIFYYTSIGTSSNDHLGIFEGASQCLFVAVANLGTYTNYVWVVDGGDSEKRLYVNGVEDATVCSDTAETMGNDVAIGTAEQVHGNYYDGSMDEVIYWNEEKNTTFILHLTSMKTVNPVFSAEQDNSQINVTLIEPLNNFEDNDGMIFFNCSCEDSVNCTYLNMTVDGTQVNSSIEVGNYSISFTNNSIPDGSYTWYCSGGSLTEDINSSTFSFEVDSTNPSINITYPNATFDVLTEAQSLDLNWTVNDTNLDACFYSYNGTNTTVTCSANTTDFNFTRNDFSINFFANDTFGHEFNVDHPIPTKSVVFDEGWGEAVVEGSTETFYLTVDMNSSHAIDTAFLIYNDTFYVATFNIAGSIYNLSYDLNIPGVPSTQNFTFFWQYNLADSTQINYSEHNQTVTNLNIGNCSFYNITLFNFFLDEERSQNDLLGDIEVDIDIRTEDRTINVIEHSENFTNVSSASICLENDLGSSTFAMDTVITYSSGGFASEVYNYYDFTLINSSLPQNVTLFDLNSSFSTDFLVTYKDESFLPVDKALISIQRKYVSEGVFKTVELPITDQFGQTVGHFDTEKGIYTVIVSVGGSVVATFNEITVICQDALLGDCDLNLNSLGSTTDFEDWDAFGGVSITTSFNHATRTITKTFATTDGGVKTINMIAYKSDAYENTLACNETLTSASGTLTCSVSDSLGNISIVVRTFDGTTLLQTDGYKLDVDPADLFGYDAFILILLLLLTLPMMLISSGVGIIVGAIMGLIMAVMLNLFVAGGIFGTASSIMWLIIAGGILIWKINQRL